MHGCMQMHMFTPKMHVPPPKCMQACAQLMELWLDAGAHVCTGMCAHEGHKSIAHSHMNLGMHSVHCTLSHEPVYARSTLHTLTWTCVRTQTMHTHLCTTPYTQDA